MSPGTVFLVVVKCFLLEPLINKEQGIKSDNDNESLLSLKPASDLALLYNQKNSV